MTPPPNAVRVLRLLQFWHTPEAAAESLGILPMEARRVAVWGQALRYVVQRGRAVRATYTGLQWVSDQTSKEGADPALVADAVAALISVPNPRLSMEQREWLQDRERRRRDALAVICSADGDIAVDDVAHAVGRSVQALGVSVRPLLACEAIRRTGRGKVASRRYCATLVGRRALARARRLVREREAA